jgi:hypothetical protein
VRESLDDEVDEVVVVDELVAETVMAELRLSPWQTAGHSASDGGEGVC